jgi:hypothetical protein
MAKLMIVMYFHYICNIPSKKRYLLHWHKDPHVFDGLFVFLSLSTLIYLKETF